MADDLATVWRGLAAALLAALIAIFLSLAIAAESRELPEGRRSVILVKANGERLVLGHVAFAAAGEGASFELALDAPDLRDEFLSMRPFRCLPDAKEMWCHLPYPYPLRRHITGNDLTDLEYGLLFLFKPPQAYGIDAWNGLYFKLALGPRGVIAGAVHEVDLNVLAVPPADPSARPLAHAALAAVAGDTHRFSALVIE